MSKSILFVCPVALKNPVRGTPLRIYNFLRQIRKAHNLLVCVKDVEPDLEDIFVPYPSLAGWQKLSYFRKLIREKNIEMVLTATEVGIKLPVFLKWLLGVKIAIDLHGLYVEERYFKGSIGGFRKFFYDKKIKFFLRFYDLIFVVAGKLKKYYERINKNIVVIYGGFNPEEFKKREGEEGEKRSEGQGVFTIGYMGNTRNYQGLNFLLEAAGEIKKKNLFPFRLKLILSGERAELLKLLEEKNLSELTELNFDLDHENVNEVISQTDVLTIPRPSLPLTEYAYPSKLPENLATGILLVLTEVGPVGELLSGQDFCMIISPEKITEELEEALIRLQSMSFEQRMRMGENARNFVMNNLTWTTQGQKINEALERIGK